MKSLQRLTTIFICLLAFAESSIAVESDNEVLSTKVIEKIKRVQGQHVTLLAGHDGPIRLDKHKETLSLDWCIELSKLTSELVKGLDANKNVFDYYGLLACGRISTKSDGYILELYKGVTDGRVDSGEVILSRHIIYFSKQGKITKIGTSKYLKK